MDYIVNILVAEKGAEQSIADADCPLNEWRGIDAPGVTPVMLAVIHSVLTGDALPEALDRSEPVAWGAGGAVVLRLDETLGTRLVDCDEDVLERCSEEIVVSEDFEGLGWQADEAYSLLSALRDLVAFADEEAEQLYVWLRAA